MLITESYFNNPNHLVDLDNMIISESFIIQQIQMGYLGQQLEEAISIIGSMDQFETSLTETSLSDTDTNSINPDPKLEQIAKNSDDKTIIFGQKTENNLEKLASRMEAYKKAGTPEKILADYRRGDFGPEVDTIKIFKLMNSTTKTDVSLSGQEMIPMLYKIIIRIMKNPTNIFSIVIEEFAIAIKLLSASGIAIGYVMLSIIIAVQIALTVPLILLYGQSYGMILLACIVAPITEEVGRWAAGDKVKEFDTVINIYESITYVGSATRIAPAGKKLAYSVSSALIRILGCCPIHAYFGEQLAKVRGSTIGRLLSLLSNITKHAICNLISGIVMPIWCVISIIYTSYRVSLDWDKFA